MHTIKAEDTIAPFDFFKKNGYYKVGDKIFNHKLLALQYASKVKQSVAWEFNSQEFNSLNWRQRLGVDIRTLYRLRAQQLRAKYQYLILSWSGGGDSSNILWSFLKNNIPLDEIVVTWPVTSSSGKYTPSLDQANTNALSEWDFAIKPQIEKIKSLYPDQKITIADMMSDDLRSVEDRDDTLLILRSHSFYNIKRYRALDHLLEQRSSQYQDIAIINGVSPVELQVYDNWLCAVFNDGVTHAPSDYTSRVARNFEFFYWTPDMPELVREQAHLMLDHFKIYPRDLSVIDFLRLDNNSKKYHRSSPPDAENFRQLRKQILYPDYDANIFQAHKSKDVYAEIELSKWFTDHPHAKDYLEPWRSCMRTNQSVISDDFLIKKGEKIAGYKIFFSKPYAVGNLSNEIASCNFFTERNKNV